ncbi:MAG: tetratricopeptide repeat protein [Planctomycetota bacterium]|nr:tetratricopeptide repeat protein [Planctomycetota bacterium]
MKRHLLTTLPTLGLLCLVTGCSGPTKSGLEARAEANTRIDTISANMTFDQAEQAFHSGDFELAMRHITSALELFPEESPYHLMKGRIFLESMNLEEAFRSFQAAQEHDPENAKAFYYAGIVNQRWSNDEQAYQQYLQASNLDENNVQYLLAAAESQVALGQYQGASNLIAPRIKHFEHNVGLKQLQGEIAMLLEDHGAAVRHFEEARMLEPEDNILLEELAWAQYSNGDYSDCISTIDSLQSRLDTERVDLLRIQAQCLAMLERYQEAHTAYIELSNKQYDDPDIWVELGTVCWELKDYNRLRQCGQRLVSLSPGRHEGYLLLGVSEKNAGDRSEAIRQLRAACDRSHQDAMPHMLLGLILEDTGFMREALAAYGKALEIEPGNAEATRFYSQLQDTIHVTSVSTDR